MELLPREKDKLLLFTAALVAERRLARGVKLNYPEVIAYISAAILEGARDGRTVAELMSYGATLLTRDQVMNDVLLAAQPTKQFVTIDEVAALAVYLASDAARGMTGSMVNLDGGWTAM